MRYEYNAEKNLWLLEKRGFGFEDILDAIAAGKVLLDGPNPYRTGQRALRIDMGFDYVFVPYVEIGDVRFLKTAYVDKKHRKPKEG